MHADADRADLVLAGGGVKGIGHVGAVAALTDAGYAFTRVAGTSAGSIVGALLAAGMAPARMREVMDGLNWRQFTDPSLVDRVPLLGPAASVLAEFGVYEGEYLREWLGNQLADLGVERFRDLRMDDGEGCLGDHDVYKLVVMATDVTLGELVRFPWDYEARYGLDPDEQLVVDAVRASMSIPLFFEPVRLTHADGTRSTLVDGGVLSNFPIDVFDRTDGAPPRWPTFGVTLLPRLPEANVELFPLAGPLRRHGLPHFLECLVTTTIVGRDQAYLSKPWVQARTIELETSRVGVVEFGIDASERDALYDAAYERARSFLATWDFDEYRKRFRPGPAPAPAVV